MKSILVYSVNKELADQLQNSAYISGIDEFHLAGDVSTLLAKLEKYDVSILFIDTEIQDIKKFADPCKIVFLVDASSRDMLDKEIFNSISVIFKPFSQKQIIETISKPA
jgi:hypothetical protein